MESYYIGLTDDQTKLVESLSGIAHAYADLAAEAAAKGTSGVTQLAITPAAYADIAGLAASLANGWATQIKQGGVAAAVRALRERKRRVGRPRKLSPASMAPASASKSKQAKVGRPAKYTDDDKRKELDLLDRMKAHLAEVRGVSKATIADGVAWSEIERMATPRANRFAHDVATKAAIKRLSRFRKELGIGDAQKKSKNSK